MPVVSITNGSRRPVVHKVFLGSRNVNNLSDRIPHSLRERVMQSFLRPASLEGAGIPPIIFRQQLWEVTSPDKSKGDWLAIGPASDLVTEYGSVDLIRSSNGTRLILNGSESDFMSNHCQAGSLIRLPIITRVWGEYRGQVLHESNALGTIQTDGSQAMAGMFEFSDLDFVFGFGFTPFFELFANVDPSLLRITTVSGAPAMIVPDCTDHVIGQFPSFTVVFRNEQLEEVGRLVVTPSDYIFRRNDGTCRIMIALFDDRRNMGATTFHFNPVLIPRLNIRCTRGEILGCLAPSV